jgi:hypothetical protein
VINIITAGGDATPTVTQRGEAAPEIYSENEFNIFLGIWGIGVKLGFSQILSAEQPDGITADSYAGGFENSMVPSLSVGMNIPLGKTMSVTPEIFSVIDIHQFVSGNAVFSNNAMQSYSKYQTEYIETKIGARLSFAMLNPLWKFEAGSGFSLVKRSDSLFAPGSTVIHDIIDSAHGYTNKVTTMVENLETQMDPYLLFTTGMSDENKFQVGVKVSADISVNDKYITPDKLVAESYGDIYTHYKETSVKPEIALGLSYTLLPNRLALHAGFGLKLWQFTVSEFTVKEALPSTKLAVGFTANLDAATTLDMLLITSGDFNFLSKDLNSVNKFTVFITRKK